MHNYTKMSTFVLWFWSSFWKILPICAVILSSAFKYSHKENFNISTKLFIYKSIKGMQQIWQSSIVQNFIENYKKV